jgi:hypothetical protein
MATSGIIKSFGQINNHNHFWSATWLRNWNSSKHLIWLDKNTLFAQHSLTL